MALHPTTYDASRTTPNLFDTRMRLESKATVAILGMSGSGKSTMGNLLLYGDQYFHEGFAVGHGADSMTPDCEPRTCLSDRCMLTVYDTPGIPDTDRARTFDRFDSVVETLRRMPSLTAMVFLIKADRKEDRDYEVFRTLLRQFTKLPCSLVMVCRVDTTDCTHRPDVIRAKEQGAYQLMDRVIQKAELGRGRVHKFIFHHGDLGIRDANTLRWFLCMMPGVPIAQETLRTTQEVESRYQSLCNEETRLDELRQEADELVYSIEKLDEEITKLENLIEKWQSRASAAGMIAKGATAIAGVIDILLLGSMSYVLYGGAAVTATFENVIQAQIAGWKGALDITLANRHRLDTEKDQMREEINSGVFDPEKLEIARQEWEELRKLRDR